MPVTEPPPQDEPGARAAHIVDLFKGKKSDGKNKGVHHLMGVLARNERGGTLSTLANAMLILIHDPVLAGMLTTNEFTGHRLIMRAPPLPEDDGVALQGPYPRQWGPEDVALVQAYLQRVWASKFTRETTETAMLTDCARVRFHPVRDWLATLKWDGKERLKTWLPDAFGATPSDYLADVGAKTLMAAVRRVRRPGCKFDCLLLLEGAQGIGKSRAIKALFSESFYSDAMPPNLSDKDAAMALLGIWCLELAEIEHLIRTEVEVIKAFLSRSIDRYRPPYGKTYVERPRQGILIGTTNSQDYLRDASGNRRIWPVKCEFSDVPWIRENRDQLWAEAAAREASGECIWLDDDEVRHQAEAQQSQRMIEDVWSDAIDDWIKGRDSTTCGEILTECLFIQKVHQGKREQMRVSAILQQFGWIRRTARKNGHLQKFWERPSATF